MIPKNMILTAESAADRIHGNGYILVWKSDGGSEVVDSWKVYKTKKTAQNEIEARKEEKTFILFTSHRARERAMCAIENNHLPFPQGYFSFHRNVYHGAYLLDQEQVYAIRGLSGWRRLRGPFDDLMRCWS